MDGKIIAYILFLVAVIAGSYGIYYTTEVDEAQRKLSTLEAQLDTTQNTIKQLAQTLEERKQIATLQAELDDLEKAAQAAQVSITEQTSEHEKIRSEFEKDIASVREQFVGTAMPELTLASGNVLKNIKIQRIEEAGLNILNDNGVTKVTIADLPQEMRDRLRYGEEYTLPSLVKKQPESAAVEKPATSSMATASQKPALDPDEEARQKRVLEGRAAIARLKRELSSVEKEYDSVSREASDPNTSASRRYYANTRKTALSTQIAAVRRQLDAAEVEMTRLGEYVSPR